MAHLHTVVAGDTSDFIARRYGFRTWRHVWNDSRNNDLRRIRPNPQMLALGDRVWIPEREPRWTLVTTNRVHEFVIGEDAYAVQLRVCDANRRPLAGHVCRATFGAEMIEATLGAEARVLLPLRGPSRDTRDGTLELWSTGASPQNDEPTARAMLRLGWLGPVETVYGIQGRFSNLGYFAGELDGVASSQLDKAAQRFRSDAGLGPDDDLTAALELASASEADPGLEIELDAADRPALLQTERSVHLAPNHLATVCIELRPHVRIVDMEDVNFHFNSSVFLPEANRNATDVEQRRCAGLSALRAVYRHAKAHTERQLICAGHADTVGSKLDNKALSKRRAENVVYLLDGDADNWAEHCDAHHQVEDFQLILHFLARHRGYACDPGEVDNDLGPNTERGLSGFRSAYATEFAEQLPPGPISNADWKAFFRIFAEMLEPHRDGVTLNFAEPRTLACGEAFPISDPGADNRRSATNRRVEMLFCHSGSVAELTADPDGAGVYGGDATCVRSYLDAVEPQDAACVLRLHSDRGYEPPAGAALRLVSDDGAIERTAVLF